MESLDSHYPEVLASLKALKTNTESLIASIRITPSDDVTTEEGRRTIEQKVATASRSMAAEATSVEGLSDRFLWRGSDDFSKVLRLIQESRDKFELAKRVTLARINGSAQRAADEQEVNEWM